MIIGAHIVKLLKTCKEFVIPSYRPERHYMRGPGPACARRTKDGEHQANAR